ncbi:MAG: hypothetical protein COB66_02190 [Coxiella sp. (in: Bacteria)]|nr:MAG: hypothetical protein COB66_02190 [Coxiella sp. (in: g-proteobacteria)]
MAGINPPDYTPPLNYVSLLITNITNRAIAGDATLGIKAKAYHPIEVTSEQHTSNVTVTIKSVLGFNEFTIKKRFQPLVTAKLVNTAECEHRMVNGILTGMIPIHFRKSDAETIYKAADPVDYYFQQQLHTDNFSKLLAALAAMWQENKTYHHSYYNAPGFPFDIRSRGAAYDVFNINSFELNTTEQSQIGDLLSLLGELKNLSSAVADSHLTTHDKAALQADIQTQQYGALTFMRSGNAGDIKPQREFMSSTAKKVTALQNRIPHGVYAIIFYKINQLLASLKQAWSKLASAFMGPQPPAYSEKSRDASNASYALFKAKEVEPPPAYRKKSKDTSSVSYALFKAKTVEPPPPYPGKQPATIVSL